MPSNIDAMIDKIETPGLRNKIIIAYIKSSPEGVAKTREALLNVCRRLKQARLQYQDTEGQQRDIYAPPTQPWEIRQKNAAVTLRADTLRRALGEEKGGQIDLELGKGRIFLGKDLLAGRNTPEGEVDYVWPTVHKHLPDMTPEALKEIQGVAAERAAKNVA